jgi:16S rRNA (cytidine1402-2'-O)-methyltransferase
MSTDRPSALGAGRLYLIPNLLGLMPPQEVLPQRTLAIARGLTHFVVETPKAARVFLKALAPDRPLQSLALYELSEHTPPHSVEAMLAPALCGHGLGLLSDAGCPAIADPGALLVAAAHRAGVGVVPLVGPSAVLLALMASGMNGQAFAFHGYLPVKSAARIHALRALDDVAARSGATQLFIETPYRNEALFAAVLSSCRPESRFCVAIDLTLPSEEIASCSIASWRERRPPALAGRPAIFLLGRHHAS